MKKLLSIVLVLTMVLSLAACGRSTSTDTEDTSSSVTPSATDESSTSATTESEPVTFDIFIDHSWFWFDKWGTEPVSQKITADTGVTFNVTRGTDDQQLALLIASGDLPDIVYTGSSTAKALLADSNVCYSYNELVEKTGVDIHATETEIRNNTAPDGNYYALLNAYTSQETIDSGKTLLSGGTKSIAYRTDIYKEIGSPEINTLEDLENALIAAKKLHPEIMPLLNDGSLSYFAEQLGLQTDGSVGYDSEGKPCYVLDVAGIKDYFALLNKFAREGLISAEAQTYNYDRFVELRNGGGSFMQLRCTDEAISSNNAATEAGSGYAWKLITNDLSDNALVSLNTGIGWSGTYITKNCSDPERAIEFISWCRSEEGRKLCSWGIQGEHWDYNDAGETITTKEYQAAIAEGKQKQNDFGIGVWIFGDQGDENAFIDKAVTDPSLIDVTTRLQSAVAHTKVMSELYFAVPTSGDEQTIYTSLQDMYRSEVLKVIFAETDEEYQAALDNMYKQANQIGIEKLETWMQSSVAEHMK